MEDIRIINESMPVIQINFDEIKRGLGETLEKYQGIIVTEQTLSGCKATQKELAGIRIKIDTYRKEKSKELSKPIKAFEEQYKDLIQMIEEAEQPIKEGIKVFDDARRDEKRQQAKEIIDRTIELFKLNEVYACQLTVLDSYTNLTAKEGDVKEDVEQRAFSLSIQQNRDEEIRQIIRSTIDQENTRLKTKMTEEQFAKVITRVGLSTVEILDEIRKRAEQIYKAENSDHEVVEAPQNIANTTDNRKIYYVIYHAVGTLQDLKSISAFMQQHNIDYEVKDQGEYTDE